MPRRRKPKDETEQQTLVRQLLESISNKFSRSEKTSWLRKKKRMENLLAILNPIEEEISELQARKIPIFDEIQGLRKVMVSECVHPYEYLLYKGTYVECKFCNKKIGVIHGNKKESSR